MMRKFAIVLIAFYGVGTWDIANALGFGELTLHSALNEKLKADIELHGVGDLSKNEIIPNIGNNEDFARANIKRLFFLTGIKFKIIYDSPEDVTLQLTTEHIVREPFLNFLVELHWPNGRLLREYTVLLDPPVFSEKPLFPITSTHIKLADQTSTTDNSSPIQIQQSKKIRIKKNDTLWNLARTNRPEKGLSIHQTMQAIQQKNPHAFINNNINMMMAGRLITMPKANEIKNISNVNIINEANALNKPKAMPGLQSNIENKTANDDLSTDKLKAPLSADKHATEPDDGQLKLVSDDAEQAVLAAGLANEPEGAEQDAAINNETSQATLSYQNGTPNVNSVLNSPRASAEITLLKDKLEELQKKISLKNEQMAQLQASLSLANKPQTLTKARPNNHNNKDDNLFKPSIYIGSLIFFALTGLVIYNIISRRKKDETQYSNDLQETLDNAQDNITLDLTSDGNLDSETLSNDHTNDDLDVSKYLEEADIYIAYSRYERAIEALKPAIEINPDNHLLQLKLAEIYIALGDQASLDEQENILKQSGDTESLVKLESLKADFQQNTKEIDSITLDELTTEPSNSTINIESLDELEFDLTDEPEILTKDTTPQQKPLDKCDVNLSDELDITSGEINDEPSEMVAILEPLADLEFPLNDTNNVTADELNITSTIKPLNELEFNLTDEQEVVDDNIFKDLDIDLSLNEDTNTIESDTIIVQSEISEFEKLGIGKNVTADMDFLEDTDEVSTKLDLAAAYVDMGDQEAATEILEEVLLEGNEAQKDQAKKLLNLS